MLLLKNGTNDTDTKRSKVLSNALYMGIAMAILIFLLVFVVYPIFRVFLSSLWIDQRLDFSHFMRLFSGRRIILFRNTLIVTTLSTVFATFTGLLLSIFVNRSHWPGRKFVHYAAILNMISPPFVSAIVYIMLFGRRGLITNQLLGLDLNLFGPGLIVLLQTIGNGSIAYLIISNVLRNLDTTLEDSALDLGASKHQVFFSVTLPLLLPGLTASASLIFANVLSDFGTPILVGAGYRVLASEAYLQLISNFNLGYASAISVVLLFLSVWIYAAEKLILRNKSFTSRDPVAFQQIETRRSMFSTPIMLVLFLLASAYASLVFIQFLTIMTGAFTTVWGYDYSFSLRHFTNVRIQALKSLQNSLSFAYQVALLGPLLGLLTAYLHSKFRGSVKAWVHAIALSPYVIPGTVMGISYVMAFHHPPFQLTGTATVIVLICMVRELPISFSSTKALLRQLSNHLEDASRDLGANRRQTFTKVIAPSLMPAYRLGMLHAFIHVMITIGAIIFLITPRHVTLTFEIFSAVNLGQMGIGAAYAFILIVFTVLGLGSLNLLWMIFLWLQRRLNG